MNIVCIKPIEASIVKSVQDGTSFVWLYSLGVILIILTCIIFCLWHYYRSVRYQLKQKLYQDSSSLDLENAINSIFGAKELYDSLKGKCHPDNFSIDSDKFEKATNIFFC